MGKTRPPDRAKLSKRNKKLLSQKKAQQSQSPTQLLVQAAALLQTSQPDAALHPATLALTLLQQKHNSEPVPELLPALSILGEIQLELGDADSARECFLQAAAIDEDGTVPEELGGGVEKFLWLAQLSEEGGEDSVKWFEKGATLLRSQVQALSSNLTSTNGSMGNDEQTTQLQEKKLKLASALCGIAEVYMTDLSFDDAEAERRCNLAMEEAITVAPDSAETLQTLANVRISQERLEEARQHLTKSLSLWKDLDPEDDRIPPFPTRISLVRLLMDAQMEDEAIDVLERLIQEDDHSVEAWYLGGWCLNLIAGKKSSSQTNGASREVDDEEDTLALQKRSRQWLLQCLKLCQTLEYEDDRLEEHAKEIVAELNGVLGEPMEDEANEEDEEWEDDDNDEDDDEEMEET